MKRRHLLVRNQSRSSGAPHFATLLLSVLLSCVCTKAFAYNFSAVNDDGVTIYYNYTNDGQEAEVTDNYGNYYSGDVVIPATVTVNGTTLNVTRIHNDAFNGCSGLTSVTIPNSVTSIGRNAFNDCSSLASVTIPNSVTSIGEDAFHYCKSPTSITIGNSVTSIGEGAFAYCSGLTSVTIPNSVISIGTSAFNSCTSLTSVIIGNSVTSIGNSAFDGCESLTSVIIPNSVTSIGGFAFNYCTGLTSVTIGSGVTNIGEKAFRHCTSLPSVIIPNSVTSIGNYAFIDCSSLASVAIGSGVTNIGTEAFIDCSNLTEVTLQGTTLPATCATNAFDNISSNATLYCAPVLGTACSETEPWKSKFNTIDASVVTLASGESLSNYITDDNKSTVTKLKIYGEIKSEDITLMANMATSGALSVIDMSEATAASKDLIGEKAFYQCSKLTSISLPYGITSIGEYAFTYCSSLTGITIPNSVKNIGKYAFAGCSKLESFTIPNSVTSIDEGAFADCSKLESITIGNSVTSIGEGAFMNCSKLTSITIPNSVTNIDNGAFFDCTSLASVTIGNSVTSIGEYAFNGCSNLAEVTLQGKTLPNCGSYTFNNIDLSKATLYCKAALVETCKVTEPWKNFNVVVKSFSVTIYDAGIATGCFDDDLNFSEVTGVKAYIASGFNPETGKVLMTNVTEVPAGTGFLVKGEANTYEIPAAATKYMYANLLVGTLVETTVAQTEDSYTNYVLGKETDDVVGFYLANNSTVPANKAYLQLPTSAVTTGDTSDAKTSLRLSFDDVDDMDDTTGITQIREQSDSASGKTVIYNLNGQRKQSLTKGLNIVNGKKIFVK